MKKLKSNWFIFTIGLFIMFSNCKDSDRKTPGFFEHNNNLSDSIIFEKIFKLDRVSIDEKVGYHHNFNTWIGIPINGKFVPELSYSGFIYKENDKIYFYDSITKKQVIYFDFGMRYRDSVNVLINANCRLLGKKPDIIKLEYILKLEDKFLDNSINDTIYKFRFCDIKIKRDTDDLVFFVSKKHGPIGIYIGDLSFENGERIELIEYDWVGNIFYDRYKDVYRKNWK